MNKENTEYLYKTYPILYQQAGLSPQESCMHWGFETGDGWFDLIDRLSKMMEDYNHTEEGKENPCVALQVKEKYGSLRFYHNGGNDEICDAVWKAEEESENICEGCGAQPATLESDMGWYSTMCDSCRDEKRALREKLYEVDDE